MSQSFIVNASAIGTLVVHVVLVIFGLTLILHKESAFRFMRYFSPYAFIFSFAVALLGIVGSILYSEIIGFDPCVLCWLERVLLYPQVIIFGIAIFRRDDSIIPYILGLSIPGVILSLYHASVQLGGFSLTACTSEGGSCSKVYVLEYGYITIPLMAFTAFLLIVISTLIRKKNLGKLAS